MSNKASTPNANGFYIWFDKENKKEYYSTPITLYKAKVIKNKNSKYSTIKYSESYIPKVSPKRNKAEFVKNALKLNLIDLYNPYEERYGMFLINFLNMRIDSLYSAYKDFFYAYSFELIENYSESKKLKLDYKDENSFKSTVKTIFECAKEEITSLQSEFKKCVNYMYNLNGNEDDKEYDSYTKFQAYSLKNDMINKYSKNTDVFNSLSIFKNDFVNLKLNELTKNINKGNINLQDTMKYSSTYLSNICFIVLNEIASNNITIKTCKNCGRYFIPVNRHAEVYCDLFPIIGGKKCRELGARITYTKSIQEVEGLLIYRRTYQKRLMELNRNPNATEKDRKSFNDWKKSAQNKIKEYKQNKITENDLYEWMKENKET